jgi:hypothetical protein
MGATATEASSGLPHGTVRVTTAGEIRAAGGTVELAPEAVYPGGPVNTWHVNVTEGTNPVFPAQGQANPIPKEGRLIPPRNELQRTNEAHDRGQDPIWLWRVLRFSQNDPLRVRGKWYFMRSYFNEESDSYADFYDVYVLPFESELEVKSNPNFWLDLSGAVHLGQIRITEVGLDETRRQTLDGDAIQNWLFTRNEEGA